MGVDDNLYCVEHRVISVDSRGQKGERKKSEDKKTALGYSLVLFTHALFNRRINTV